MTQRLTQEIREQVPGVVPLIQPYPTLEIDTGATSNMQGRRCAFQLTSTDPDLLYKTAEQLRRQAAKNERLRRSVERHADEHAFEELEILRDQAYS